MKSIVALGFCAAVVGAVSMSPTDHIALVSEYERQSDDIGSVGNCEGKAHDATFESNRTLRGRVWYQCLPPGGPWVVGDQDTEAANRLGRCIVTGGTATCQPIWDSAVVEDTSTVHRWRIRGKQAKISYDAITGAPYCDDGEYNDYYLDGNKVFSDQLPCRRDDDSDSYSPDDSEPDTDCDDGNNQIYPGAYDTNPQCGSQDPWTCGDDYNCNGIQDCNEISAVCSNSPIVIDVSGNGFLLTDRSQGVRFDLDRDGRREQLPWTDRNGDDVWLTLDRNGNGLVDDGGELFGNYTPQPPSQDRNGFLALAVFDGRVAGGNGDGWIDQADPVFQRLRLWRDSNHDGVSQPVELRSLGTVGVRRIALQFREFLRVDQFGNWFRFGARIFDGRNRDIGAWAFDVFLDYPTNQLPPGPSRRRAHAERIGK